jgi:hypothetical protein
MGDLLAFVPWEATFCRAPWEELTAPLAHAHSGPRTAVRPGAARPLSPSATLSETECSL